MARTMQTHTIDARGKGKGGKGGKVGTQGKQNKKAP